MKKISKLFFANRWKIAYRAIKTDRIFDFESTIPFKYVTFPKGFWGADPFLFKRNGKIYLFCEYTNEKKSKSFISFKELFPNEEKEWHVAYEFAGHTSYPCIFEQNSQLFMIPETTYDETIRVLKYINGEWKMHSCLLRDINAPDTTFLEINQKPYIFVYEIFSRNKRSLRLCQLNEDLTGILDDIVVKTYSEPDGRPGGNCFSKNGKLCRVTQPGVTRYGEKINVFEFDFDGKRYSEKKLFEIKPNDISIKNKQKILGIHTFNKVDNIEVIDMLVKGRFDLFRPIKILFKRMRFFGFGQYEKDRKFVNKEFDKNI